MNRNISQALFEALAWGGMTAKELGKKADVAESQISRFRNGGDIYSSVLQRLIDGLPENIYDKFLSLINEDEPKNTNVQIAEQILDLAYELRQNRKLTKQNKQLILNGNKDK